MGCTKAEGFGAAQHGGGSCWERGGSRARQLGACIGGKHGKPAPEEKLMDSTAPSQGGGQGQGAWVGRLSEPMEVSEDTTDDTMEGGGE
eukprot:1156191-Pelagomonas_calceolata.AAC.7